MKMKKGPKKDSTSFIVHCKIKKMYMPAIFFLFIARGGEIMSIVVALISIFACRYRRCSCWIFLFGNPLRKRKINGATNAAKQIVEEAKREGEALKKEALLEAKDEIHTLRTGAELEIRDRRSELQKKQENRLMQKEENLDRKDESLDKREQLLEKERGFSNTQTTAD
ncbi:hypothetical protein GCM10020331_049100 [Ectobacillus funiculus]